MKYQFYSVKNGWKNGNICRDYYCSSIIDDPENVTKEFVDCSGREIKKRIESNQCSKNVPTKILNLARTYHNWYYYPKDITLYYQTLD